MRQVTIRMAQNCRWRSRSFFKSSLASNGLGQSFSSKRMPVYIPERSRWDKTVFSAQNWAAAGPIFYHV